MIFRKKYIQFFCSIVLLAACAADKNAPINIKGYDYAQMKQVELEHPLKEISGIAYWADSNSFVAVNDEKGIMYLLDPQNFRITNKFDFEDAGDYEEIQVYEKTIYILRSDGKIYKLNFDGTLEILSYTGPKAEYESFYVDVVSNTVVLIPKHSKTGAKEKQTVTYTINASDGTYANKKEHVLSWSDLKSTALLHPSAVAIHPVSKDIYLLASIEKRLIVLNSDWKLLAEYELDRTYFLQPEGITFDPTGNLYITNEGGGGSPTLIQIPILSN
ncbi:SdiA-regulated domain-containing protein [Cytophaga aurantiaca]|uniref:SdiA-regulated domain-containing protein n=1 Tax=Cytophaga aurantiaca TaxID=29530 RepID=UPI000370250A|nr:SdiA-regulated domain-containing protein [Cytophaga aurantiaca]